MAANVGSPPIADVGGVWHSRSMLIVPRLIALASIAVFLLACGYVGYVNEQLKGAIGHIHRAAILSGFLIGAAACSRYLSVQALKRYGKSERS